MSLSIEVYMIELRYPEIQDAEAFYNILKEFDFPYYHAAIPASIKAEQEWIERRKSKRDSGLEFNYAIVYEGNVVGGCEIMINKEYPHIAELGYFVGKQFWNKGIASECVNLLEEIAFNQLGIKRIEIRMDPRNARSEKVAIKNGYKKEGVLKKVMFFNDEYHDNLLYAKLNDDIDNKQSQKGKLN